MKKVIIFSLFLTFSFTAAAYCGETITAKEIDCFIYAGGKIEKLKENLETTFYIEGDRITKTRVYNVKKRTVIPDKTVYKIQKQLPPDLLSKGFKHKGPTIRAVGEPGVNETEILVIDENHVQTVKSAMDYFVISRYKIIK
jgi:hypothetical protein